MSSTDVDYVLCNLCNANNAQTLYQLSVLPHQVGKYNLDVWDIVKCQICGLIYENPRPGLKSLNEFYRFDHPEDLAFVENWFIENEDLNRGRWRQLLRAMSRYRKPGKLLDLGCGAGSFLTEAQKAGYDVSGQEISPFFIDYCRNVQNLTIYTGPIENLEFKDACFDFITAFDLIEHHPDPASLLKEMRRLVKEGGMVVVGTHNIGNYFAQMYGQRWRHLYAIGHLTYFTRRTLTQMMEQNGFEVIHFNGAHTIDGSKFAEMRNYFTKFFRVIVLRAFILGIYRPLTDRLPMLTHWSINLGNSKLNHSKLLRQAGDQIIMNDNMLILAIPK